MSVNINQWDSGAPQIIPIAVPEPQQFAPAELSTFYIKVEDSQRKELQALSPETIEKLHNITGKNFCNLAPPIEEISIENVVWIHTISGKLIFGDLSQMPVVKYLIDPGQVAELTEIHYIKESVAELKELDLIQQEQLLRTIRSIKKRDVVHVSSEIADRLNNFYLKRNPFDFKSILSRTVQKIEKLAKEFPPDLSKPSLIPSSSKGTKRPRSETASPEDEDHAVKKPRIAANDEQSISDVNPDVNAFSLQTPSVSFPLEMSSETDYNASTNKIPPEQVATAALSTFYININDGQRKNLRALSLNTKDRFNDITGRNLRIMADNNQLISIEDAALIHAISNRRIFGDLRKATVAAYSIHPDLKAELQELLVEIKDKNLQDIIAPIISERTKYIVPKVAEILKTYFFNRDPFDFKSILFSTVQKIDKLVKEFRPSLPKSILIPPPSLPKSRPTVIPPPSLPKSILIPPPSLPKSILIPPPSLPKSILIPPPSLPKSILIPPPSLPKPRPTVIPPPSKGTKRPWSDLTASPKAGEDPAVETHQIDAKNEQFSDYQTPSDFLSLEMLNGLDYFAPADENPAGRFMPQDELNSPSKSTTVSQKDSQTDLETSRSLSHLNEQPSLTISDPLGLDFEFNDDDALKFWNQRDEWM